MLPNNVRSHYSIVVCCDIIHIHSIRGLKSWVVRRASGIDTFIGNRSLLALGNITPGLWHHPVSPEKRPSSFFYFFFGEQKEEEEGESDASKNQFHINGKTFQYPVLLLLLLLLPFSSLTWRCGAMP